ncbi:Domain of uncharacterised function (DUF1983) [Providencia alcalifaciens]|nr:Domain of uncharacterised function (DUF1983) [Providencia alcalifaciens]
MTPGGRISSANGRNITLDRVTSIKAGDRLIINLPDGKSEGRTVTSVNKKVVTVSVEYSQVPQKEAVWVVDSDDLAVQLYRVINISDNGDNTYTISGAIHNPDHYDHIDSGARIDERPVTVIPPRVQPAPKKVEITSYSRVDQGMALTTLSVSWDAAENAIAYEAQWRRDNGNWVNAPRTSSLGFDIEGVYSGRYQVRVRAVNASEISSIWANAPETTLTGKVGNPPKPVNFRASPLVFGIKLDWGFGENTSDTLKTEIQYSKTNDGNGLMLLADVPYPSRSHELAGLAAGIAFYFRARLVDKSGNESEWTSFVRGESEFDVNTIMPELDGHFMTAEAGKQLDKTLDWLNEACLINMAATYELQEDLFVKHGQSQAQIKELWRVYADSELAWAEKYTTVNASINGVKSEVATLDKAIAKLDSAFAESQTQLQVKFDEQEALINTKMQAEFKQGEGYAMHSTNITIVVDDKKYNAAGMVISAELKNGKIESFIGFNANNFAFYNPVNGKMEPFLYMKNGQVFMNEAFISKAWLNEVVVTDKMTSANYVPGKVGFNIDAKTGDAEFNKLLISGDFKIVGDGGQLLIDGTGVTIFDENKRWATKLGRRPV